MRSSFLWMTLAVHLNFFTNHFKPSFFVLCSSSFLSSLFSAQTEEKKMNANVRKRRIMSFIIINEWLSAFERFHVPCLVELSLGSPLPHPVAVPEACRLGNKVKPSSTAPAPPLAPLPLNGGPRRLSLTAQVSVVAGSTLKR
ncbi:hypothetical protein T03_7851 [Trichinella britovi]|uniref:Uncharacterized protein n=1 Tax=Trichinella britovi TaxID=45882 RepID=A0A0V1CA28_TRIBR|nr:hypothetical protein T03_7851 [Trichinella britovi]